MARLPLPYGAHVVLGPALGGGAAAALPVARPGSPPLGRESVVRTRDWQPSMVALRLTAPRHTAYRRGNSWIHDTAVSAVVNLLTQDILTRASF